MKTRATGEEVMHALEAAEAEARDDYSGRCMYGAKCPAFECETDSAMVRTFLRVAAENPELAAELARDMKTDSMGRGMVVYFPSIRFEAE